MLSAKESQQPGDIPHHSPCMLQETLTWLHPQPGHIIVDMTVGLGGHGKEIVKQIGSQGLYIGFEWDPETYILAQKTFGHTSNVLLYNRNFLELPVVLQELGIESVNGVLLDAGVNLYQLTAPERSMAQNSEYGLDMRMNRATGEPAEKLIARASEEELQRILRATLTAHEARRIARAIVQARRQAPIRSTRQLSEIILSAFPPPARYTGRMPAPALLAFRIAVNRELDNLAEGIRLAVSALRPGGRIVCLTFHSAEFRVCRATMRQLAYPCQCPPRLPCRCGKKPVLKILTPKPLTPTEESLRQSGPQCRSARLNAAERIAID